MAEQMMQETAGKTIPAGYKQTEVGVIPKDWVVSSIGEVGELTSSKRIFESDYVTDGIPFYRGQEISALIEGKEIKNACFISKSRFHQLAVRYGAPQRGDILITAVGTLGNSFLVNVDEPFYFKDGNLIWLRNISGVFPGYLIRQLHFHKNEIVDNAIGSSQKALTIVVLKDFKFPLPINKQEQTAIANVLSDSDALIDALEQLIAKKQAIKSAAMQQLLTGRTRLPAFALRPDGTPKGYKPSELGDIPEDWEVAPFGNTLAIRHGKNQKAVENPNGTIPIFATGGQIGWAHQYLWNKPSVLIGRKGTIDKPRYSDKPFWTVDTLFYSEIKDCADPKFIFYKFCMIDWMQYNEASGVPSLNASTIERVLASLPLKEEQTAVAKILSDMDTEIQVLEQRLGKTCQIKQGMMQELLTGKTRLIEGSEAI
ncbi:restriction endonuclease subunit S [Aeromonas veronii]|uniref:restriction endonuclease subunit S n=1 Tax=Aeromonas veronii TaxID=654 RepID=UPI00211D53B3|nr:restriction endonuclease subunit S [Aeromonas veronii]UUM68029.1 restriction endonuclease subunit S [Aeromonas veronii]